MALKFVVWRAGEPMGARVVRGKLARFFWHHWFSFPVGASASCEVTDLSLAHFMPMEIATMAEDFARENLPHG